VLVDPELYRRDLVLGSGVRLSALDVRPEQPDRTMLLLHGFGGSAAQWELILKAFASRHRLVALDLRGHGRSDKPRSQYTMDELVRDLEEAVEALVIEGRFVLWGHSFGGAVATEYALRHPGRVGRLVLSSATGDYRLGRRIAFLFRLPSWFLDGMREAIRKLAKKRFNAPAHVLKPLYNRTLMTWQGWERFRRLKVPTLVIHGARDYLFRRQDLHRVAKEVKGAEHVEIAASYHMVILDRSDAVVRAVERFIGEAPGRRGREAKKPGRPWLAHYEEGVPPTVAVPEQPLDTLLRITARRSPARAALRFLGRRISYRQLDDLADRFASGLQAMGVRGPERVMLVLPNAPQAVFCYYGALRAGCTVVLGNPLSKPAELARQAADSGARVVVVASALKESVEALRKAGPDHVLETRLADWAGWLAKLLLTEPSPRRDLREALPRRRPRAVRLDPRGLAVIAYTGGTTDDPKGVMLSHRALVANTVQLRHWIPRARQGRERILAVLPFSHSYGMTACMNLGIAMGATLVVLPRFDPSEVLRAIARSRPTLFPGVPPMYNALANHPKASRRRLRSVRFCVSGAAPLPLEVQEGFERVTRARLVEGYGLTEAGPVTHANPLEGKRRAGTIGLPLPGSDAKVVDLDAGRACRPGEVGELLVRGPQVMMGYWGRPADSAQALDAQGWLRTGDLAAVDGDGYFTIVERKRDMVVSGKLRIYPRDVEEVLYEHPKVFEAAVVGRRQNGRARLQAFVVLKRGEECSPDEILAFCRRRLKGALVPAWVEFRGELPKSFVGKVLRRLLVEPSPRRGR
jgi:long-chain acyl-CoA synthetase